MHFTEVLNTFDKITLEEMDGVKLMDRTDTKFNFHESQFAGILESVRENYSALEIKEKRMAAYHTLYYDTKTLDLYMKHQNGALNRYKVRHRTYVDSNLGFLEVKFKNSKGRTIKTRIKNRDVPMLFENETEKFLSEELPFSPSLLVPSVWVNYKRITLVSKTTPERLTLDTDLHFILNNEVFRMDGLVIAEVKQDKKVNSAFIRQVRDRYIREGGISKYCLAVATTYKDVRKNTFKPKIITLQKILNYAPAPSS